MSLRYGTNQRKQGVKSKFVVALIAFAIILGVKVLSSKSDTDEKNTKQTIIGY